MMKSSLSATTVKFWRFARGGSVADKAGLIILKNLSREYTSGQRTVHALDGVSLEIAGHEFVAISGPSGCGKSTLIHLLAGLDRPTAGEIVVDGLALQTYEARLEEVYGLYFKVARAFVRAIGNPAVMRELTRIGMQSRTIMEWALRIMANLLRPDELGPAEAAYGTLAQLVRLAPEP